MRFLSGKGGKAHSRKVTLLLVCLTAAFFIHFAGAAQAGEFDNMHIASGSVLLTFCAKSSGHTQSACLGYIAGVSDAMINDLIRDKDGKVTACIPRSVTVGKRAAAVVSWFNRHTHRMAEPAATLVAIALAEAYPCE